MITQQTIRTHKCWCGNTDLSFFNTEYSLCKECGTLVSLKGISTEELKVNDDDKDFYGKQYWIDHQKRDLGLPDIHVRVRNDLIERNLHWLTTFLKYRLPPARVLELGCAHGSFVALLRQAGFDAAGVEMSPWVVEFGRKTFEVPISIGPVERLEIPLGSIDAIALMDVLEHLPDPVTTMGYCLKLLKPDGLMLIQTPEFKEDMSYTALVETNGPFLDLLKADEHLYLFSQRSIIRLFKQFDANNIKFEPAIFNHYDMFLAVSQTAVQENATEQIEKALLASANGRFALALLDLSERSLTLTSKLKESEVDRSERWIQIETLTRKLKESEIDRSARLTQIETLTGKLKESEVDRSARLTQIETLTRKLKESEVDRSARWAQIETLTRKLKESEEELPADLLSLLARPSFRWFNRILGWPEVKKLEKRIESYKE